MSIEKFHKTAYEHFYGTPEKAAKSLVDACTEQCVGCTHALYPGCNIDLFEDIPHEERVCKTLEQLNSRL